MLKSTQFFCVSRFLQSQLDFELLKKKENFKRTSLRIFNFLNYRHLNHDKQTKEEEKLIKIMKNFVLSF